MKTKLLKVALVSLMLISSQVRAEWNPKYPFTHIEPTPYKMSLTNLQRMITANLEIGHSAALYPFYVDADGDGYGTGEVTWVESESSEIAPVGYALNNTDCDDSNPNTYRIITVYTDLDQDGYTVGEPISICAGSILPAGYSEISLGADCNDTNANRFTFHVLYVDQDQDGYTLGEAQSVCIGNFLPAGYSKHSLGQDCNDTNPNLLTQMTVYVDKDGDGYSNGESTQICMGNYTPTGYVLQETPVDCNDNNPQINPGANEIPNNGIDENCDGSDNTEIINPITQIASEYCGTVLESIGSRLAVDPIDGATRYRFKIKNLSNGHVQFPISTTPVCNLMWLSHIAYNTSYEISVQVEFDGTFHEYGPTCIVTTPAEGEGPNRLNNNQCDTVLPTLTTNIFTESLNAATGYRYRITNLTQPDDPNAVQIIDRLQQFFNLTHLTSYTYGITYSVEIATLVNGSYTEYGPACLIQTPVVPSLLSCGSAINSRNQLFYTSSLLRVTQYRFEVTDLVTNEVHVITRPYHYFHFNLVPGFEPDHSYSVRVAVFATSWSPYGESCVVNSGAAMKSAVETTTEIHQALVAPNPYQSDFGIQFPLKSQDLVDVKLFDIQGRQIQSKLLKPEQLNQERLGQGLPSGIYTLMLCQGSFVQTVKIVKN